jgi:heme/copper-type cytochrome/quinol oxidase subunit 4
MLPEGASNVSSKFNSKRKNNQFIFALVMIALQIIVSVLYGIYGSTPAKQLNVGSVMALIFLVFLVVVGNYGLMKVLASSSAP